MRVLLRHAGVTAPHTGAPLSQTMLFGIAGGIETAALEALAAFSG